MEYARLFQKKWEMFWEQENLINPQAIRADLIPESNSVPLSFALAEVPAGAGGGGTWSQSPPPFSWVMVSMVTGREQVGRKWRAAVMGHPATRTWWTGHGGGGACAFVLGLDPTHTHPGLPRSLRGNEFTCQGRSYKRWGFSPWVGKIPWKRA